MPIRKGAAKLTEKDQNKKSVMPAKTGVLKFDEIILHEEKPALEALSKQGSRLAERWQPALAMFMRLSGWILAPLILGVSLGKWLDYRYGTAPWLFLITTLVAFLVSMAGLVKNALEEFKKIENEETPKDINDHERKSEPKRSKQ